MKEGGAEEPKYVEETVIVEEIEVVEEVVVGEVEVSHEVMMYLLKIANESGSSVGVQQKKLSID